MANNQSTINYPNRSGEGDKSGKNSFWIIALIVVLIIIILWPAFRRGSNDTAPATSEDESSMMDTEEGSEADGADASMSDPAAPGESMSATQPAAVAVAPLSSTLTIKAFFRNEGFSAAGAQCESVYPVFRTVPRTVAIARAALNELLGGVNAVESSAGFKSAIGSGIKINSLTIAGGVAQVDFSQELVKADLDDCAKAALKAQITQTLTQFPTVNRVVISVAGSTLD